MALNKARMERRNREICKEYDRLSNVERVPLADVLYQLAEQFDKSQTRIWRIIQDNYDVIQRIKQERKGYYPDTCPNCGSDTHKNCPFIT